MPEKSSPNAALGVVALAGAGAAAALLLLHKQAPILVGLAVVATDPANGVSQTGATLNGEAQANGAPILSVEFEYGTTTSYGQTAVAAQNADGSYSAIVTLLPGAEYHFRIVATDTVGPSNGNDQILVTPAAPPTVVTEPATSITGTSALLNGTVDPNGSPVGDVYFEWGTTPAYGYEQGLTTPPPTGGTAWAGVAGIFGLTPGQTYHYQMVATNAGGTTNGGDQSFVATAPAPAPAPTPTPSAPAGMPSNWCSWSTLEKQIGIVWLRLLGRFPSQTPNSSETSISTAAQYIINAAAEFTDDVNAEVANPTNPPANFFNVSVADRTMAVVFQRFLQRWPSTNMATQVTNATWVAWRNDYYNKGGIASFAHNVLVSTPEFINGVTAQAASYC